jgi:hypothetical protein
MRIRFSRVARSQVRKHRNKKSGDVMRRSKRMKRILLEQWGVLLATTLITRTVDWIKSTTLFGWPAARRRCGQRLLGVPSDSSHERRAQL